MKTGKALRTLQFCWSYAELAAATRDHQADEGLIGFHAYFNGSLDVFNPNATLNDMRNMYKKASTRDALIQSLTEFSSIATMVNIGGMVERLAYAISDAIERLNDERCDHHTLPFTAETLSQVKEYVNDRRRFDHTFISQQGDTMDALVGAIICDASMASVKSPVSLVDTSGFEAIARLADQWARSSSFTVGFLKSPGMDSQALRHTTDILKCLVACLGMLKGIPLDDVRFGRTKLLGTPVVDALMRYGISDKTLAALPRPTHELIELCGYNGSKPSQNGLLYMATYRLMSSAA